MIKHLKKPKKALEIERYDDGKLLEKYRHCTFCALKVEGATYDLVIEEDLGDEDYVVHFQRFEKDDLQVHFEDDNIVGWHFNDTEFKISVPYKRNSEGTDV